MNTSKRLIEMVLRGSADKFKTVLQEALRERASELIEELYQTQTKQLLNGVEQSIIESTLPQVSENKTEEFKFIPESSYQLKDGNIGILSSEERQLISKLYESLNNDNKERVVKLLSESQNSFNKVRKLAKTQSKNKETK